MILLDKFIMFLRETKLTEKQVILLFLIYEKRKDLNAMYKATFGIKDNIISDEDKEIFKKLGFIVLGSNKKWTLSDKFLSMFVDKHKATEEIFFDYPVTLEKDGVLIPLKAMDRNIFANLYQAAIMGSYEEHKEVMLDLKFGINNKMINIGIEKFLKSKYWLTLRKLRLENKVRVETHTELDNNF